MDATLGITGEHLAHFERNGFFLIPNPFGAEAIRQVDIRQQEMEPVWERTRFPQDCKQLAAPCIFAP